MGLVDRNGQVLPDELLDDRRKKAMAVLSAALQICDGLGFIILITPGKNGLKVQPVYNKKELNKGLIQGGFTGLHFSESLIQNEIINVTENEPTAEKEKVDEQDQSHIS